MYSASFFNTNLTGLLEVLLTKPVVMLKLTLVLYHLQLRTLPPSHLALSTRDQFHLSLLTFNPTLYGYGISIFSVCNFSDVARNISRFSIQTFYQNVPTLSIFHFQFSIQTFYQNVSTTFNIMNITNFMNFINFINFQLTFMSFMSKILSFTNSYLSFKNSSKNTFIY